MTETVCPACATVTKLVKLIFEGISAIIVAIQMITTFCKTQKYRKTIVLVTNADGKAEADGLEDIARKLKDENINLVIL